MDLAGVGRANGGGDLLGLGVLEHVARRAGLEGGGDLLLLDERGHGHDLGLGPLGLDPADGGDAVHVRHEQVHEHDVGLEPAGHGHALAAVGGLAHDLDVGLEVEEHAKPHPDDGVVVDDQDADPGSCRSRRLLGCAAGRLGVGDGLRSSLARRVPPAGQARVAAGWRGDRRR